MAYRRPLGITITMGATGRTLTGPDGDRFDLGGLDRGKTRALADSISEAMGLSSRNPKPKPK